MTAPYRLRVGTPVGEMNPRPARTHQRDEIDLTWQDDGACVDAAGAAFFPPRGTPYPAIVATKRICEGCPVLEKCREHGLRHEKFGIWGGLSERERRRIRKEQGISIETPGTFGLSADLNRRDVA